MLPVMITKKDHETRRQAVRRHLVEAQQAARERSATEAAKSKGSMMSHAKWAKLLDAVAGCGDVRYKAIGQEGLIPIRFEDALEPSPGMLTEEGLTSDGRWIAPVSTRHIEYVVVPFDDPGALQRMRAVIDGLGRFAYEVDDKELTITLFGYR